MSVAWRLANYETCRDQFLTHRKSRKDIGNLIQAIDHENRTVTDEDCANIERHGAPTIRCSNRNIMHFSSIAFGTPVEEGDWQNMAAIGWTQPGGEIRYNCGGTIVSDFFVLTAAHCGKFRGKAPDIVRVGDRFLVTPQDDHHAQQFTVEKIIAHPQYTSREHYNDIALIKTRERIKFTKFVAPACLVTDEREHALPFITGYGQPDYASNATNTLQEILVQLVPNGECNKTFAGQSKVPRGIIESQLCVQGFTNANGQTPDSCLGDSGGPVQYKLWHTIHDRDYARTLLKTIYDIPAVIGLVSFGVGCALEIPSVNTRVAPFVSWLETAMNEN